MLAMPSTCVSTSKDLYFFIPEFHRATTSIYPNVKTYLLLLLIKCTASPFCRRQKTESVFVKSRILLIVHFFSLILMHYVTGLVLASLFHHFAHVLAGQRDPALRIACLAKSRDEGEAEELSQRHEARTGRPRSVYEKVRWH